MDTKKLPRSCAPRGRRTMRAPRTGSRRSAHPESQGCSGVHPQCFGVRELAPAFDKGACSRRPPPSVEADGSKLPDPKRELAPALQIGGRRTQPPDVTPRDTCSRTPEKLMVRPGTK